jgi:hypothetical protein
MGDALSRVRAQQATPALVSLYDAMFDQMLRDW